MSMEDEMLVLRQRTEWPSAVENLRALVVERGTEAMAAAEDYGNAYAACRGSMVFDVVASSQRQYRARVVPMVREWEDDNGDASLRCLAHTQPNARTYGLKSAEPATMQAIAQNLLRLADSHGLDEDEACRRWAHSVQGLEHAHSLDPVVGSVPGIGPALFAYMRMRCGADALKPDGQVAKALRGLGFDVPVGDGHAILVIARAVAHEVGLDLLTLDQLLWWS